MATYDDLFGSNSGGDQKYIKFTKEGEVYNLLVIGEPDPKFPQKDFRSGKTKYLVKFVGAAKYQLKLEGEFDPDGKDVENSFVATDLRVPVRVVKKKDAGGNDVEGFEEFDTFWDPSRDQKDKLKDEMLETRIPLEKGTIIALKYLADGKPKKYVVRLKAAE